MLLSTCHAMLRLVCFFMTGTRKSKQLPLKTLEQQLYSRLGSRSSSRALLCCGLHTRHQTQSYTAPPWQVLAVSLTGLSIHTKNTRCQFQMLGQNPAHHDHCSGCGLKRVVRSQMRSQAWPMSSRAPTKITPARFRMWGSLQGL